MSRAFISEGTGAGVYVFSDDHCPAHVHARHRGEGRIARVRFSFLGSAVEIISIVPVKNVPLQRVVNRLLSDVQVRLPDCRQLLPEAGPRAKQISEAEYDPATEQVLVIFQDGTTEQVKL